LLTLNVPLQIGKCTPGGTCTPGWEPLSLTNKSVIKALRRHYVRWRFAQPEKHLLFKLFALLFTFASNKELSNLPANRIFYSGLI